MAVASPITNKYGRYLCQQLTLPLPALSQSSYHHHSHGPSSLAAASLPHRWTIRSRQHLAFLSLLPVVREALPPIHRIVSLR